MPWVVALWDDDDFHGDDLLAGTDEYDFRVTDASFTEWLHRRIKTDGTPWYSGNKDACKTERVR